MKFKFIWSNEDAVFILGGLVGLLQINFDTTNAMMPLAIGMILKGLMSMFSITLGNDASEDVMLIIGAVSTLIGIHFDYHNPLFALTLGAIIKAGFGIFGVNLNVPVAPVAKALLIGFLMFAFTGPAFCDGWNLPEKTFGIKSSMPINRFGVNAPTGGTINGLLVPTASLGISVDQSVPSYGANVAYDLVIGGVNGTTLTPYFGIGGAFYFDIAPWINSNLNNPVEANGGFNVLGPEIGGQVPSFQKTWNFQSGEQKTLVMFTFFNGAISDLAIKIFGQ